MSDTAIFVVGTITFLLLSWGLILPSWSSGVWMSNQQ